jgi:hypothetical protein
MKDQENEVEERDFEVDVKVNKYKLDEENEKQASLYNYWASLLADAKTEKDDAEDALTLVKAKADADVRQTAADNSEKVTEAVVQGRVLDSPKVQKAQQRVRDAKSQVYHLEAAVKALEHRKSSLDNLTVLWTKSYYATPDGGKPATAGDAFSKDIRRNLNRGRNREE